MEREYNDEERNYLIKEMKREAFRLNEPELRDFKRKLENDFIRKSQACQMIEKEYAALREQINKKREQDYVLKKSIDYLYIEEQAKQKINRQKNVYANELLSQIEDHQKILAFDKERNAQERQEIDRLASRLAEENSMKLVEKKEKVDATQREMKLFQRAKEVNAIKEKLISIKERIRIDKSNRELDERSKLIQKEKKGKFDAREALIDKLAANLHSQQKAYEERAQLIQELQEHEYLQNDIKVDYKSYDLNKKHTVNEILTKQIEANNVRAEILKKQEAEFTQQLEQEIQKQKDIEYNENKLKESRQQQYTLDIKHQINENLEKERRQNDMIMMTNEYIKQFNNERKHQIEKEKDLMIKEHNKKMSFSLFTFHE